MAPPQLELLFTIPRIIETILVVFVLIKINEKFKGVPLARRPLLHLLFFFGMICWLVYISLDIFIFGFASISFNLQESVIASGYDPNYPSLLVSNILRDFAFMGAFLEVWCYFFVPSTIIMGENATKIQLRKWWVIPSIAIVAILLTMYDQICVEVNNGTIFVYLLPNAASIGAVIIAIMCYNFAAYRLRAALNQSMLGFKSKEEQEKIRFFIWGIFSRGIGYILSILANLLFFNDYNSVGFMIFANLVVHFFFALSPIYIYLGLTRPGPKQEQLPAN